MKKLLLCISALACLLMGPNSNAQLVDVINETVQTAGGPGAGAFYPAGYSTYRIYARMNDAADRISAVFGSSAPSPIHTLNLGSSAAGLSIYNHQFGGTLGSEVNCGLWGFFAEAQWDSHATVGRTNNLTAPGVAPCTEDCGPATDPGTIFQVTNPAGVIGTTFAYSLITGVASGPMGSLQPDLSIVDGAWFVANDGSCNGFGQGADFRVLIAQVTVPTGTLTYSLNIAMFDDGVGAQQHIYAHNLEGPMGIVGGILEEDFTCFGLVFPEPISCAAVDGCMDNTACNYDPLATNDDGSCTYPGCNDNTACNFDPLAGCLAPGSCTYPGCMDIAACNYDITAGCPAACTYPGCDDNTACNFDAAAGCSDGSCCYGTCAYLTITSGFYDEEVEWSINGVSGVAPTGAPVTDVAVCIDGCFNTFFMGDTFGDGWNGAIYTFRDAPGGGGNVLATGTLDDGDAGSANIGELACGCTDMTACNYDPAATIDDGSCEAIVANDECSGALPIACGETAAATTDGSCVDIPAASCAFAGLFGIHDTWYSFTYTGGNVSIETTAGTNTDTVIGVYDACGGAEVGCDDDSGAGLMSLLTFTCPGALVEGTTYYIQVGGWNNGTGTFSLTLTCTDIPGCTDPTACNYDVCASSNDGSCTYPGCTDNTACNFDPLAGCLAPGSCTYPGCNDNTACNFDPLAGCLAPGSCTYPGCNDNTACNFDPLAGCLAPGSCTYPGCNDNTACNFDPLAGCLAPGSCTYPGCNDIAACNFDPLAGCLAPGSCTYPGCNDIAACNFDPLAGCLAPGSCTYPGCNDIAACNFDPLAGCLAPGSCTYPGCNDIAACNFDPLAGCLAPGSCTYPGCNDIAACNFDPLAGCLAPGSCTYPGCNNPAACNYNAAAGCNDGSCTFPGCTDPLACNYDATAGCDDGSCVDPPCNIAVNDTPAGAIVLNVTPLNTCNNIQGDLTQPGGGATDSPQSVTVGPDLWYCFVAVTTGIRICVDDGATPQDINIVLFDQLLNQVDAVENANPTLGDEYLNYGGLVPGAIYYFSVGNCDVIQGSGVFNLCVQWIPSSDCDYGPGPYNLCSTFKADWVAANAYKFYLTSQTTLNTYTKTQNSPTPGTFLVLSTVPGLTWGDTYDVEISAIWNLTNGAGVEAVEVMTSAPCVIVINPQPTMILRPSDNCVNHPPHLLGNTIAGQPFVCASTNYKWEFVRTDVAELPIVHYKGSANRFLKLSDVPGLTPGGTYDVRVAPVFSYGDGTYGPYDCIQIAGPAMQELANGNSHFAANTRVDGNEIEVAIYPNPSNGEMVNLNLTDITSDVVLVDIYSQDGKLVYSNQYTVNGTLNALITFEKPLASGMYMVNMIMGTDVKTERFMVQR